MYVMNSKVSVFFQLNEEKLKVFVLILLIFQD